MNLSILGMGWATPLGTGVRHVWERILRGERAEPVTTENPHTGAKYWRYEVPAEAIQAVAREPRLRRSSPISHLALSAALDAIRDAGIDLANIADRTAVVFGSSNGSVIYTRRFFADVLKRGTHAGSPALFPETVYNTPASHIAAKLGITGSVQTIVSDATVGLGILKLAQELIACREADYVLAAAAEESDWIICDAYRAWRLVAHDPPAVDLDGRGAIFSDGAAAVLVGAGGPVRFASIHAGLTYPRRTQAPSKLAAVLRTLLEGAEPSVVITSHNGSRLDAIEARALDAAFPRTPRMHPKFFLGEALAATALAQVIGAASFIRASTEPCDAIVSVLGFNGHLAGLRLTSHPIAT